MNFLRRDHKIEGWRQLDYNDDIACGDLAISSKLGHKFSQLALDGGNKEPRPFIRNENPFFVFGNHHRSYKVCEIIRAYENHLYGDQYDMVQPEGMTYSVWRQKKPIPRRSWQDEQLPLP